MKRETELIRSILANAERIKQPAPALDGVVVVSGAQLQPTPIAWLWPHWLALGKLHLLAGAPGQGKTTIATAFAATVTSGGRWPDGTPCASGNVLLWSGEDDPADTLLPRVLAAGGKADRVYFVQGSRVKGELLPFDPARDMAALQAEAERIGNVRLLIVDPIVSAVAGDSHKNTETRRALQPLVDLAGRMNAALLGITHLSKGGQGNDPAQRVQGSVAFTAVARVVMVAAKVRDDDGHERRILARGKSNIGPDDGGFEYSLVQTEPIPGINASRVEWGPPVQGTARELLTEPSSEPGNSSSALEYACQFLRDALEAGSTPSKTVQADAREAGISQATLRRASDSVGVIKTKGAAEWYWRLPTPLQAAQPAQDVQPSNVSTLSTLNPGEHQSTAERLPEANSGRQDLNHE